jgi:hypothetical protein
MGQSRSLETKRIKAFGGKAVDCNGYPIFRANQGVKGAFGAAQRLCP